MLWVYEFAVGIAYSVIGEPLVGTRPILLPLISVNHKAPSGPPTMPLGRELGLGSGNVLTAPASRYATGTAHPPAKR